MSGLQAFEHTERTYDGETRTVYMGGSGPGVVVMHEMPCLHPGVVAFAQELIDAGFTVWMPSMFGDDGAEPGLRNSVGNIARGCVAREFTVWRTGRRSTITDWLRQLARDLADHTNGTVGAVGMCFTGGFALAMMVDPWLTAPVCSQPSLPFGVFPWQRSDLGIDPDQLEAAVASGCCVLALRYRNDPMVPPERFTTMRRVFGDRFDEVVVDDWRPWKHSVLSTHRDEDAVQHTLAFLKQHCGRPSGTMEA